MFESQWRLGGLAGRPHGRLPNRPSTPNRLNYVGGSSPQPLYKDSHGRIQNAPHSTCSSPLVKAPI
jgi:hypothetical protein